MGLCAGLLGIQAQMLTVYNFNNSIAGATAGEDIVDLTPSNVNSLITASNLSSSLAFVSTLDGGPVNPTSLTNAAGGTGQNPYVHNGSLSSEVRNIDGSFAFNLAGRATRDASGGGERFLSFTVGVSGGREVELTSFSFQVRQSAFNGLNSNGANTFRVLIDGIQVGSTQTHDSTDIVTLTFDLSSLPVFNTDFEVALGLFGGGGTNRSVVIDDLTLNGLAAIPEPSVYATFLGLFVLGYVVVHRRRKSNI
ncbi:MAG: hypothetical protein LR015_07075 [Verrucomicrobia bacterium]|nr:hypothetical protein [Verrucomicrobiota bacterium]